MENSCDAAVSAAVAAVSCMTFHVIVLGSMQSLRAENAILNFKRYHVRDTRFLGCCSCSIETKYYAN